MAKPFYKNPILMLGLITGFVAIYILTTPDDAAKRSTAKKTTTAAKTSKTGEYTEEDRKASFEQFGSAPRNVFRPIVTKNGGNTSPATPSGIPAGYAGGEANWTYTGMATVDGVPNALLENPSSGESIFVKQGESWKTSTIEAMSPETLVLRGPNGDSYTIRINGDIPGGKVESTGTTPVRLNNPLRGQIGRNQVSVEPLGSAGISDGNEN